MFFAPLGNGCRAGHVVAMATLRKTRPIAVEEYLEGEKVGDIRHQFVGGDVYSIVGASEAHNLIAGFFQATLYNASPAEWLPRLRRHMKLRTGDDFYYPDVFVACDRSDAEPYFKRRPLLIVEVLSPGTAVRDAQDKLIAYQAIGSLREYVLAEQDRREVRVHRRVTDGWESATDTGAATVPLESVDLALPLDEIYRNVLP
jgi:Uma2 family endonuclease